MELSIPNGDISMPHLSTACLLVGSGKKADLVWTKREFLELCEYMLNENPTDFFLTVYRDKAGNPKFGKASSKLKMQTRASWAWATVTGMAKSPVGIGFYPTNAEKESRWAAMDFDAHDGNKERARRYALAAFQFLFRHPELSVVLSTSGSDGWHLFVFARTLHPVGDWIRLLKQVAEWIGAEIGPGICEIFPNEGTLSSRVGYGIRAPGTWNPKQNKIGIIWSENVSQLLPSRERRKNSVYSYRVTEREHPAELPDSGISPSRETSHPSNWHFAAKSA